MEEKKRVKYLSCPDGMWRLEGNLQSIRNG